MSWTCLYAQEVPRSTQYVFNNILLNPAVSGIGNYIDLKLGYRKQWSGIEGAPTTQYLSFSMPLGDEFVRSSINSFSSRGYNPLSRSYVNTYTSAEPHHGIGVVAMTDKAGLVRQTGVSLTYAYHLGLSSTLNLALGVSGGFNSLSLNVEKVNAEHVDDPLFSADYNNRIRPDVGFGFWLYSPRFFFGASGKQILGATSAIENSQVKTIPYQYPTVYSTAGFKVFLGEDVALIPSTLVSYWFNAPLVIDGNLKLAYQDKFWLGGSYRNNDSFSMLAGINVASLVNLSYSYDMSTSALRNSNSNTHEIGLGILLNNYYDVKCAMRQF